MFEKHCAIERLVKNFGHDREVQQIKRARTQQDILFGHTQANIQRLERQKHRVRKKKEGYCEVQDQSNQSQHSPIH